MLDLIFIGATIVFFLMALAYVRACEKLQWAWHAHLARDSRAGRPCHFVWGFLRWPLEQSWPWQYRCCCSFIWLSHCCDRRSF